MKAFHNNIKVKAKYLNRVSAHKKADEIIKGKYWENGKGCAVGCTIYGSDHERYETELGIPTWLALLEDTLFEGMPDDKAKIWPVVFLKTIKVGSDLESIKIPFLIYLMKENLRTLNSLKVDSKFIDVINSITQVKSAIKQTIKAHLSKDWTLINSAHSAAALAHSAAYSAANSARSAAYSAANSAAHYRHAKYLLKLIKNCK